MQSIQKIKSKNDDCLWLLLNKNMYNTNKDLYICCCYLPPSNSQNVLARNIDVMDTLHQEILLHESKGNVILIGDLNSRTGNRQEQWVDIICTETAENNKDSRIDFETLDVPLRFCQDAKSNTYGNRLIDIINESHLLIMNGRTPGDMLGSFTYHGYNGSSCIDLCICSKDFLSQVQYFKVHENPWYTDHSPIALSFKVGNIPVRKSTNIELLPLPNNYKWDDAGQASFTQLMHSEHVQEKLKLLQIVATRADGIPAWILKNYAEWLATPLTFIFNSTIRSGHIPKDWKTAHVVPLPKNRPPKSLESDLRPISLTPICSKLLESFV